MIFSLLAQAAESTGKGVWHDGRWSSYARLADEARTIAAALRRHDVCRGDVVAVVLGAEPTFVASIFACAAVGAVAMPINPRYEHAELSQLLAAAGPRLLVTRAAWADRRAAMLAAVAPGVVVFAVDAAADVTMMDPVTCGPDEVACIFHSSGSTGRSKLIRRTHGQILAEVEGFAAVAHGNPDDVWLSAVPLFHAHGFSNCMLASIRAAARLVIAPEGLNAVLGRDALAELVEAHRATVCPAVPMTFELLAHAVRDTDLSRLRLAISAGTGLPETVFRAFMERFRVPVRQLYGCSEGGALTLNTSDDVGRTWDSVGPALPGVRLRIDEPDKDGVGLIGVGSLSMTAGYDGLPELNAASFIEGWFQTGDRGRLDEDGFLYITGKRALYIEVAGHKIDPYEVEDVLTSHPQVREAAVVGLPGRWGTRSKAVVVPEGDAPAPEALRRFCAEQLADYKVPHLVEVREALPRSPLGKVLKKYLLEDKVHA